MGLSNPTTLKSQEPPLYPGVTTKEAEILRNGRPRDSLKAHTDADCFDQCFLNCESQSISHEVNPDSYPWNFFNLNKQNEMEQSRKN